MSVFVYSMHMQIPNRIALVIPPNSWPRPNMTDDIIIAGMIPVLIFSRLNRTPLKTNSSTIGAKIMAPIASRITTLESISTVSTPVEIQVGSFRLVMMSIEEIKKVNRNANNRFIAKT